MVGLIIFHRTLHVQLAALPTKMGLLVTLVFVMLGQGKPMSTP